MDESYNFFSSGLVGIRMAVAGKAFMQDPVELGGETTTKEVAPANRILASDCGGDCRFNIDFGIGDPHVPMSANLLSDVCRDKLQQFFP